MLAVVQRVCGLGCVLLLCATATAAEWRKEVQGRLTLDAQGQVSDLVLRDELPSSVADGVVAQVRGWRFSPVLANGQPAAATLNLNLELRIEEVGDRLRFRIENALTNLHMIEARPPRYPKSQLRAGRSGYAVVRLQIDESGRVRQAESFKSSHADFARAAERAGERFRFEPLLIDGQPASSELLMPIHYTIAGQRRVEAVDLSEEFGIIVTDDTARFLPTSGGQLVERGALADN